MTREVLPLLRIEGLTQRFGWLPALRGLDCALARGQIVALLGANGSGKTTLLRLCAGLLRPSEGRIRIGGWDLPRDAAAVRAHIGYVGHQPLHDEMFSALENLRFFADCYGMAANERASVMLERIGLSDYADEPAGQLSRGRQQLLSIARACLHEPDLLLLDEPMSNLDAAAVERVLALLAEARARDSLTLWVTHDLARAREFADRALILHAGKLVFDSAAEDPERDWARVAREMARSGT